MAVTKLLGALLLVSACAALGLERSLELRRRVRNLSALLDALALMRTKICRLLTPLPEMAEDLGREAPEPVRPLFLSLRKELPRLGERPFSELWAGAVEASRGGLLLRGEEAEALCALGLQLGGSAAEQERAIECASARLELCLQSARAEAESRCRLYAGLGLASGLLLSVVLL